MSTEVWDVVTGPPQQGLVMAAFPRAVYIVVEQDARVLALESSQGLHLPCALVLERDITERPFTTIVPSASVRVGEGRITAGETVVTAAGWWEPTPRLREVETPALANRIALAYSELQGWPDPDSPFAQALLQGYGFLDAAVSRLDPAVAKKAAAHLVGLGPGLTPAGDDLLAGTLSALVLMGTALGDDTAVGFAHVLHAAAAEHVGRTTLISATLLYHAARGAVARPVASLLHTLVGHGDVRVAVADLVRVGHSSGHGLATGILLGSNATLTRHRSATQPAFRAFKVDPQRGTT